MNPTNVLRQPSRSAGLAIFLITVGTLCAIWSGVWYYYLRTREVSPADGTYFVCWGGFLSGIALVIIGCLVGYIGRTARQADVPVAQAPAAAVAPAPAAPAGTTPVVTAAPPAAAPPRVVVPQQVQKS
jgi:hypothetical protein